MTILLTGGFGTTASRIAERLQEKGVSTLIASRNGQAGVPSPYKGVTFEWTDESTWENPWKEDKDIEVVYLVTFATIPDVVPLAAKFIDLARIKGTKRFVLLSGSPVEQGTVSPGKVHEYLAGLGVEYAVLRPSWFFDNFLIPFPPNGVIPSAAADGKADGFIRNSAGDGKVGFISSDDIADAAVDALTGDAKSLNTDQIIVGPELLSHAEVAAIITKGIGKKVIYETTPVEDGIALLLQYGMPADFAKLLTEAAVNGDEERRYAKRGNYVGKVKLADFVEQNKVALAKNLS